MVLESFFFFFQFFSIKSSFFYVGFCKYIIFLCILYNKT